VKDNLDYRFHHIGFVVHDVGESISKWEASGYRLEISPVTDPLLNVVFCTLVKSGELRIELVSPSQDSKNHPLASRLRRGGGLDHVCYVVGALELAIERETTQGGLMVMNPTFAATFNTRVAFVLRLGGILVELMEGVSDAE